MCNITYLTNISNNNLCLKDYYNYENVPTGELKKIMIIYKKQFKYSLTNRDIKKWFKNKYILTVVEKDSREIEPTIIAFARWFIYKNLAFNKQKNNEVYLNMFNLDNFIFLSDLASIEKPGGKILVNHVLNIASEKSLPVITVPRNNSLISYYKQFGFKPYYPDNKKMPSVVMIKTYL